jgi:hypothetical protein
VTARALLVEALCSTNADFAGWPSDLQDLSRIAMTPFANAVLAAGFIQAPWGGASFDPFDPFGDLFQVEQDEREASLRNNLDVKAADAAILELSGRLAGASTEL